MAMYNTVPDYRNPYKKRQVQQQQNQQWLEKMKADLASGSGAYGVPKNGSAGSADPYQFQQRPTISAQQGPYQMPGGPGQISTVGNQAYDPAGPRPQQLQLAYGQHQYMGPKIAPTNYQPGKGIGAGGPTQYVGPYGQQQNRGTIKPGYNQQNQFMNTVW